MKRARRERVFRREEQGRAVAGWRLKRGSENEIVKAEPYIHEEYDLVKERTRKGRKERDDCKVP